jgi:peptidyl-prolyl cis-trans isomerase D
VIVQVKKIEPAQQKTYEQVADEIKKTLAQTKARSEIADLRDKVEDERAGGATLAEVGKKLNLSTRTIDAVDRSGRNPAGAPVANLPKGVDVVSTAFSADVGVETDPLQLPGGGFVWVDVTGVTPSRERTLDEVKNQVSARWREDEIATRLKAKADDMLAKLKSGTPFAQVAGTSGASVETVAGLQRGQGDKVPAGVLDAIFKTAKGQAGTAEGKSRSERVVFVVTEVDTPKLDPNNPQAKQIAETLQRGYSEDVLGEYVARLENDLGVKLNQEAINQALGRSAPQ